MRTRADVALDELIREYMSGRLEQGHRWLGNDEEEHGRLKEVAKSETQRFAAHKKSRKEISEFVLDPETTTILHKIDLEIQLAKNKVEKTTRKKNARKDENRHPDAGGDLDDDELEAVMALAEMATMHDENEPGIDGDENVVDGDEVVVDGGEVKIADKTAEHNRFASSGITIGDKLEGNVASTNTLDGRSGITEESLVEKDESPMVIDTPEVQASRDQLLGTCSSSPSLQKEHAIADKTAEHNRFASSGITIGDKLECNVASPPHATNTLDGRSGITEESLVEKDESPMVIDSPEVQASRDQLLDSRSTPSSLVKEHEIADKTAEHNRFASSGITIGDKLECNVASPPHATNTLDGRSGITEESLVEKDESPMVIDTPEVQASRDQLLGTCSSSSSHSERKRCGKEPVEAPGSKRACLDDKINTWALYNPEIPDPKAPTPANIIRNLEKLGITGYAPTDVTFSNIQHMFWSGSKFMLVFKVREGSEINSAIQKVVNAPDYHKASDASNNKNYAEDREKYCWLNRPFKPIKVSMFALCITTASQLVREGKVKRASPGINSVFVSDSDTGEFTELSICQLLSDAKYSEASKRAAALISNPGMKNIRFATRAFCPQGFWNRAGTTKM